MEEDAGLDDTMLKTKLEIPVEPREQALDFKNKNGKVRHLTPG
jgi:hypothetical protein